MKYYPNCGSKKDGNFCADCGFNFNIEKKQNESLPKKHLGSVNRDNPKSTIEKRNNNDHLPRLNCIFSKHENLYFLKEIPINSLLKLIRLFDYKNDDSIKNLKHLIYYKIEQPNTMGGVEYGIFSINKLK